MRRPGNSLGETALDGRRPGCRRAIREYIAAENPRAALALDELISERANRLPHHPSLGRPGRVAGTRELVIHPNYILVYDGTSEYVRILRVLHAAQQWPV